MNSSQNVLTTGQVAKICNVAPRTVSKWFDSGRLRGYRIPGSKDRRIPLEQLVRFMKAHHMPLNGLDGGRIRVVVADADEEFASELARLLLEDGHYEVESAPCAFSAGVLAQHLKPHTLVVDFGRLGLSPMQLSRFLRGSEELQGIKVIAIGREMTDADGHRLLQQGCEAYLRKPFDAARLMQFIQDAVAVVY